jgi:hypothetical protein
VLRQIRGNRELTTIERRIAEPDDSRAGLDPQRDEVAPRAGNDHTCVHDFTITD